MKLNVVLLLFFTVGGVLSCASSNKHIITEGLLDETSILRRQMAEELIRKHNYDQAIPYLNNLLSRYPNHSQLHVLLGIVLFEKEAYAAAEMEIKQAIALNANNAEAYAALGILKNKIGQHQEAEALHRKSISFAPRDARFRNNLGFCLLLVKRFPEAEESILEAIHLDPGHRRAFNNLGFIYGLQEKQEDAMQAFSKAGSHAMALTNMGMVAEMLGRPSVARQYYEKALRSHAGYPPALRNLQVLDPQTYRSYSKDTSDSVALGPSPDLPATLPTLDGNDPLAEELEPTAVEEEKDKRQTPARNQSPKGSKAMKQIEPKVTIIPAPDKNEDATENKNSTIPGQQ